MGYIGRQSGGLGYVFHIAYLVHWTYYQFMSMLKYNTLSALHNERKSILR